MAALRFAPRFVLCLCAAVLALGLAILGGPASVAAAAAEGPVRVDAVEVQLVAREAAVVPGGPLLLGLRLQHDPHWHSYWRNPGDSGLPTQIELKLPAGFSADGIEWPAPTRLFIPPLANYGYEGEIVLPVPVSVPADIDASALRFDGKVSWLMCRDICIPGEAEVSLRLPVAHDGAVPPPSRFAGLFESALGRMPGATLEASVAIDGDQLLLGLPQPLDSAEFFPYHEGLIGNAEPQSLQALDASGEMPRRLELRLSADGAREAAADPAVRLRAAEGILVAGDRIYELKPVAAAGSIPKGIEIARVAGAPAAQAVQRGPGFGSAFGSGGAARSTWFADSLDRASGGSSSWPVDGASPTNARSGSTPSVTSDGASSSGASGAGPGTATSLLIAALFAALGGLVLNLMPCVFPVIGLKVLGFARHAGDDADRRSTRAASRDGALAFALGVLVSFWLLALVLIGLREAGQAAGWGFQLQSPAFVAAMALLFVAIALNFSGVWEFGTSLTRLGQFDPAARPAMPAASARALASSNEPSADPGTVSRDGSPIPGAFGSGVLAVLVATPCTAPFMGSALGFTLSATTAQTLVVFTALGLGMALPYLLLGLFPAWLRLLPRPGRWMESLRQALAFPMYASAAWLAWVLGRQAGVDAMLALAFGALLVALAAWLYGRFVQRAQFSGGGEAGTGHRRWVVGSLAVLSLLVGLRVAWPTVEPAAPGSSASASASAFAAGAADAARSDTADDPASWQPWSVEAVAAARAAGRPVFVEFTAAWCVSCQVNKRLVLDREPTISAMQQAGVLRLRADWTSRDATIAAELARHQRNGVPLYLLYRPGVERAVVLPELLTPGIVLDSLAGLGPAERAPSAGSTAAPRLGLAPAS